MKKITIYAKGKDRTGIISEISKAINNCKGNIETSKMIKLETDFNILALVEIDDSQIDILEKKLNDISELSIEINDTGSTNDNNEYRENKLDIGDVRDINYQKELEKDFLKRNVEGIDDNNDDRLFYFRLKGADNEGIVYLFTSYFYNHKINILDLETEITNAPVTGQPLFFLKSKLLFPLGVDSETVKSELIKLSNINNVAIKFERFNQPMDY